MQLAFFTNSNSTTSSSSSNSDIGNAMLGLLFFASIIAIFALVITGCCGRCEKKANNSAAPEGGGYELVENGPNN